MALLVTLQANGTKSTIDTSTLGVSSSLIEIEIDFGNIPIKSKRFIINDVLANTSSKIIVNPSGNIATARGLDDWEWDSINFAVKSNLGSFVIYAKSNTKVGGKRKIFYTIN
jgi:hypothetical protein